ncbi:MAG TPA: ArsA-related P-loop ATPase [Microthrixaceae bacterium]|nr:ArsA-related P-loop ATPase [Microthrixaceae bacterium]
MADRSRRDEPSTLEQLCASKEIIVSTGSGGVGKTTTAAALAATAATNLGLKVLVLTVDPARRLATALGMERFGNVETRVPAEAFEEAGVDPQGELWAAMLDTKQSWDDLIRQHAPDAETRDAILANPLYQNITGKFVQSHDYVAMERLYEIHTSGRYDLIVVDTPPTRNAVDFLDAPERMADFFSSRLLRWLIAPYRSRVVGVASRPFYSVADRILGTQFLEDIAEFFILFQSMYDGFVERADAVTGLLGSNVTSFVVVSTLEVAPAREAEYFLQLLTERRYHVGALVLNKTLPEFLLDRDATDSAKVLAKDAAKVAGELDGLVGDDLTPEQRRAHLTHVLGEVGSSFLDYQVVARREAEQRSELSAVPSLTCSIPYFSDDIHSLAGLLALGGTIWR